MSQQSGIKFLLFLIAVAAVAGTFFYVFKPNMDDKKSIDAENVKLEEKYNELKERGLLYQCSDEESFKKNWRAGNHL